MSVLEYRDVVLRHEPEGPAVVQGASFSVAAGERVALLGLNGSGKTTLLMGAVGLVAHQGEIAVGGQRLGPKTLAAIRAQIGFLFNVPEDQLLFPKVIEDVAFGLLRRGAKTDEAFSRARAVLDELGVAPLAELPLHHLSHGEKQRVALAGALICRPPLLLLDEPSAGLDPPGKGTLAQVLCRQGAAMLIATHDLEFADRLCTRFLLLEHGRIALDQPDSRGIVRRWQGP